MSSSWDFGRNTRLAKLDAVDEPYAALVLLFGGWEIVQHIISHYAVSQGALAVDVRSDDTEAGELCKKITYRDTLWKCIQVAEQRVVVCRWTWKVSAWTTLKPSRMKANEV